MKDIYITWENYHKKIEQLAKKVYDDNWKFNQVICIAKGGLRVGDVFSRLFNVPLAILSVESYHGSSDDVKNQQGQFTFSRDLAKTTPNLGSHVLLVDDLADSGKTLIKSIKWLELFYGFYLEEKIKTAVIWHKSTSKFKPDYIVDYLEDNNSADIDLKGKTDLGYKTYFDNETLKISDKDKNAKTLRSLKTT